MSKVGTILLVDDSKATNFFNKTMLQKLEVCESIIVLENGQEALQYIIEHQKPDLIFLDINMPVMNGWDFMDALLKRKEQNHNVVLMLGTELSSADKEKLSKYSCIKGQSPKMLTTNFICELMEELFEFFPCK